MLTNFACCPKILHVRLVRSLLIGDDGSNRWFDKSFQLIVDGNGQATINFEHSWGDGVAVLRLMEESYKDTNMHHFVTPDTMPQPANETHVKEIDFNLTPSIRSKIENAQKAHVQSNSGLDFATMEYQGLNKDTIKKSKMSPDSIMQLAIQMAYYSLYKDFVPTYESCSTAAFLKGRTECMRSATAATREATLALLSGKTEKAGELLLKCSNAHSQLVKEASMGQGFDRHLLGLKITAERLGQKIPALFEDPGFVRMSHFVLSTSTLSTNTIVFGGFGPVVEDGLGIGYNVSSSRLGAVITSHKKNRDAKEFSKALVESLDALRVIVSKPMKYSLFCLCILYNFSRMGEESSIRPDMVEAARKFMLMPKVRDTPFEEQRQFLIGKGVTDAEIAEARASIPQNVAVAGNPVFYAASPQPQQNRLVSFAQSVAVIGCVSYAGYRFLRSFVLPRFFDIPDPATEEVRQLQVCFHSVDLVQVNELQNSIKFVLDSVSQTTSMLGCQQQEINRALLSISQRDTDISRVEAGISTIKSLLLSHNNFAPILAPTATTAKLPSWQQAESPEATVTSGYTTPPANYNEMNGPEGDELSADQI
ncbi:Choline/Carnitine O-acyltransferase [Oesophagostomum dentatum]|uniref:Choline/Carnitine O-acyltransferase n=1 Tax=Oesophagostomum dentatum TaxID=61180 RepID=A0A0B1TS91_OESDE|nr:Choline/Carnitine O-acyltransferase [Oesophagostomum dentatum]